MVSEKDKHVLAVKRETTRTKKMKTGKIKKKLYDVFMKLNNKICYGHFEDVDNMSYYNLLSFLNLLEKLCEDNYGHIGKKYKKEEVEDVIVGLFENTMTERQAKTLNAIDKVFRKSKNPEITSFRFKGLLKSKSFEAFVRDKDNFSMRGDKYYEEC